MQDHVEHVGRVDSMQDHAEHVGRAALERVNLFSTSSSLVKPDNRGDVEAVSWSDINLGRLLDQGNFSCVYEATLLHDRDTHYAVKCLRQDITEQQQSFKMGAIDLCLEAQILGKLMHPNIIHLYGCTGGCISKSFREGAGFFLVLDLLIDTLDKRLIRWHTEMTTTLFSIRSSKHEQRLQLDRIENVALGVAQGFFYLHSRGIVYRDLKPHNVGFDEQGVVRIFDFGLAREVDSQGQIRHTTGPAGTPRYMSPECAKNESCSFPSDVYSFSILFWEILTLKKPFESIKSLPQFNEEVVRGSLRPSLKRVSSAQLKTLLKTSWDEDPANRPSFETICETIQNHLSQLDSRKCLMDSSGNTELMTSSQGRRSSLGNTELMTSRESIHAHQDSERCFPLYRRMRETTRAVDRPKCNWFQRFRFKRFPQESPLDLSSRSFRIRHYDLERRWSGSQNLRESVRSDLLALSQKSERRRSSNSGEQCLSDSNERRLSNMSERMAETLAVEAESKDPSETQNTEIS